MTLKARKFVAFLLAVVIPVGIVLTLPLPQSQPAPNGELPSNGLGRALAMLLGGAIIYHLAFRALGRWEKHPDGNPSRKPDQTTGGDH